MARQENTHSQLKKPLVVEALLEVRYPPSKLAYGFIPGQLYGSLVETFPQAEDLPAAQAPLDPALNQVIRHRFKSSDGNRMCQVGVGVLTINHVNYLDFPAFINDCGVVLEAAKKIELITKVDRLGLRYINMAPLDRGWGDIITFRMRAPEIVMASVQAQEHKWVSKFQEGLLTTTVAWPTTMGDVNKRAIALDFDRFWEAAKEMSVDDILKWVRAAHDDVYQAFKSSLQLQYFHELEVG